MTPGDLTNPSSVPKPLPQAIAPACEHLRTGQISSSQPPTTIQVVIRKILNDFESQTGKDFQATVTEPTAQALAKIDALFDAMYGSETFTLKDERDIEELSSTLVIEQEKIKHAADLSKSERKAELKSLEIAQTALNELKSLASALRRVQPLEDQLQECFEKISDHMYAPEYEGDALLAVSSFAEGMHFLKLLHQNASIGIEGTAPKNVSRNTCAEAKSGFTAALEDWTESALEGIRAQKEALLYEYRNAQGENRTDVVRLLGSLLAEERTAIRTLLQGAADLKETRGLREINKQLIKAAEQLNEEARALAAVLKKEQILLDRTMAYGSPEWKKAAEKHLPKPELKEPKEWSPTAKRLMYGLFQGVQVYNQGSQMNQRAWEAMNTSRWTPGVQGKIAAIGATASLQNIPPVEQNAAAAAHVNQGVQRLESTLEKVDQTLAEMGTGGDNNLKPLFKELAQLKEQLVRTHERAPKNNCTLVELAHWTQEVDDQCYAIERMENRIGSIRVQQTKESAEEERLLRSLKSFIEEEKPEFIGLNWNRLLQHLLLDFHGRKTGLEGYQPQTVMGYLFSVILARIESFRKNPLCGPDDLREFCREMTGVETIDEPERLFNELANQFQQALGLQSHFDRQTPDAFVQEVTKRVNKMQPGDSFFFAGGWTMHAIVYEVVKEEGKTFTFRIYNRGQGSERHALAKSGSGYNSLPFTEVIGIAAEDIASPVFLHGLHELNGEGKKLIGLSPPDDLYEGLMASLKGRQSNRYYSGDYAMRQLLVGHCTYLSFTGLIMMQMGDPRINAKFAIELQMKTLHDYYEKHLTVLPRNEMSRRLVQLSLEQISRNILEVKERQVFTEGELLYFEEQISRIQNGVAKAEEAYQNDLIANAPVIEIQPVAPLQSGTVALPEIPVSETKTPGIDSAPIPYIDKDSWVYDPKTFVSDLQNFIAEIKQATGEEIYKFNYWEKNYIWGNVKHCIEAFMKKIPLNGDRVFWDGLGAEGGKEALGLIHTLADLHIRSKMYMADPVYRALHTVQFSTHLKELLIGIKLLTLGDILAKKFSAEWDMEFPHLLQPWMGEVLEGKTMVVDALTPYWKSQLENLRDYWRLAEPLNNRGEGYEPFFQYQSSEARVFHEIQNEQTVKEQPIWGDVQFAMQWAARPEIRAKMPSNIVSLPITIQAARLLANREDVKDFKLPDQFFAMRSLSNDIFYLLCELPSQYAQFNFDRESYPLFHSSFDTLPWTLEITFASSRGDWIPSYMLQRYRSPIEVLNLLERVQTDQINWEKNNIPYHPSRDRLAPHSRLITFTRLPPKENKWDESRGQIKNYQEFVTTTLPRYEALKILSLSSVRKIQLQETLSFFRQEPQLLRKEEYRRLFLFLLNEDTLFLDELKKQTPESIHFVNQLSSFIKEQLKLSKEVKDTGSALFFIEANRVFADQAAFFNAQADTMTANDFASMFFDTREALESVLGSGTLNDSERKQAYRLLHGLIRDKEDLDVKDASLFVEMTLFFSLHDGNDIHDQREKGDFALADMKMYTQLSQKFPVDDHFKNQVLNQALKSYLPGFRPTTWVEANGFPYYRSADGEYLIDLMNGHVGYKSGRLLPIPTYLKENPFVKSILGNDPSVLASTDGKWVVQFKDAKGNECKIIKDSDGTKQIVLWKLEGRWYQAFDANNIDLPKGVKRLFEGQTVWIERQDQSTEQGDSKNIRGFVLDPSSGMKTYRLALEGGDTEEAPLLIKGIYPVDSDGNDRKVSLGDIYKGTEYKFLSDIEDKSHVLLWQDQTTGEPVSLELPRFNLRFNIVRNGDERVAWVEGMPGYRLAKTQLVPALGDYPGYLLVENDRGHQKVLLPMLPFRKVDNPLVTTAAFDFDQIKSEDTLRYTVHRLAQEGGIIPESREARFHLGLVSFWERDYERALKHFRGDESQLTILNANEIKMLQDALSIGNFNSDTTPEAYAIRLFIHYLLKKNAVDFKAESYSDKAFKAVYAEYEMTQDQLGTVRLTPQEEAFLLQRTFGDQRGHLVFESVSSDIVPPFRGGGSVSSHFAKILKNVDEYESLRGKKEPKYRGEAAILKAKREQAESMIDELVLFTYKGELSTATPSVLRTPIEANFWQLYALLQQKRFDGDLVNLANAMSDLSLSPGDDPEHIKLELLKILNLNIPQYITDDDQQRSRRAMLAKILKNVLFYPERFPPMPSVIEMGTETREYKRLLIDKKVLVLGLTLEDKVLEGRPDSKYPLKEAHKNSGEYSSVKPLPQIPSATPSHRMSVWLQKARELEYYGVEHLERVLKQVPGTTQNDPALAARQQELAQAFARKTNDPAFNAEWEKLGNEVLQEADLRSKKSIHYQPVNEASLHTLESEVRLKRNELSDLRLLQVEGVLALANKPFDDPALEAERQINFLGKMDAPLSLEELTHLFYTRNIERVAFRNPALKPREIEALFHEMMELLIITSAAQQQQRILDLISSIDQAADEVERQALLDKLAETSTANRQYRVNEHPEYLVHEVVENKLIRKNQIQTVQQMFDSKPREGTSQRNGAAIESPPGAGKSSTVLPALGRRDADGTHLAITVMPENLLPSMAPKAQQVAHAGYGSGIELMPFTRDSIVNEKTLQRRLDRLKAIVDSGKELYAADSWLQNFDLKFKEIALAMGTGQLPFDRKVIHLFQEIFSLYRSTGRVTIDELDQVADIRKPHHFTIGTPETVHPDILRTTSAVFTYLVTNDAVQKKIALPFIRGSQGLPITDERYRGEVKPLLVQGLLNGEVFKEDRDLNAYLGSLTDKEKALVSDYLNEKVNAEATDFVDRIPEMKTKNILAVYKDELNRILPLTLSQNVNEHYGPRPEGMENDPGTALLSIPYSGSKNPSVKRDPETNKPVSASEHGTSLELINYTCQMHLYNGVPQEVIVKELNSLAEIARKELGRGMRGREKSDAYAQFRKIFGDVAKYDLLELSGEDVAELTEMVNRSPSKQMYFISKFILPNVKEYNQELSGGSEYYEAAFETVKGCTGTLSNPDSLPRVFYDTFKSTTTPKTIAIIYESSPHVANTLHYPSGFSSQDELVKSLLDQLDSHEDGFNQCFIDAAGVFREADNFVVAKELLSRQPQKIRGVAYIDQRGEILILERDSPGGIPIANSRLPKEAIVAYYDQKNTRGTDLVLGATMKATVSFGRHSMLDDLIQAEWRMRGLGAGQTVKFVVMEEDRSVIAEVIERLTGEKIEGDLTLDHLTLYAKYIERQKQGDDNFRSFKSKMEGVFKNLYQEAITSPGVTPEDVVSLTHEIRDLFVKTKGREPYDVYGKIQEMRPREEVVRDEVNRMLKSPFIEAMAAHPAMEGRFDRTTIEDKLKAIGMKELSHLPLMIKHSTGDETGVSLQVERAVAVETNVEVETNVAVEEQVAVETQTSTGKREYLVPLPEIAWPSYSFFSTETFIPAEAATIKAEGALSLKQHGHANVISIGSALGSEAATLPYKGVFNERLLSSLNFMPIYKRSSPQQPLYRPFGEYQDIVSNILVVENHLSNELSMVLLDQYDVNEILTILEDDRKAGSEKDREVRVCLYNLVNGVIGQGAERFDVASLERNKQFTLLKAQAKFFGGYLSYSKEELNALEPWIKDKGVEEMLTLFRDVILRERTAGQATGFQSGFAYSDIDKLFTKILHGQELSEDELLVGSEEPLVDSAGMEAGERDKALQTLKKLQSSAQKGEQPEAVLATIKDYSVTADLRVRHEGIELMKIAIETMPGMVPLFVKEAQVALDKRRARGVEMYFALNEKGFALEEAAKLAKWMREERPDLSLKLYSGLIKNDFAIDEAIKTFAQKGESVPHEATQWLSTYLNHLNALRVNDPLRAEKMFTQLVEKIMEIADHHFLLAVRSINQLLKDERGADLAIILLLQDKHIATMKDLLASGVGKEDVQQLFLNLVKCDGGDALIEALNNKQLTPKRIDWIIRSIADHYEFVSTEARTVARAVQAKDFKTGYNLRYTLFFRGKWVIGEDVPEDF